MMYLLGRDCEGKEHCIGERFSSVCAPCFEADPVSTPRSDDTVTKDSDGEGAGAVDQDLACSSPDPGSVSEHDPCTSGK